MGRQLRARLGAPTARCSFSPGHRSRWPGVARVARTAACRAAIKEEGYATVSSKGRVPAWRTSIGNRAMAPFPSASRMPRRQWPTSASKSGITRPRPEVYQVGRVYRTSRAVGSVCSIKFQSRIRSRHCPGRCVNRECLNVSVRTATCPEIYKVVSI